MLDRPHDLRCRKGQVVLRRTFGWTYQTGDEEKYGGYITAWKNGKSVAGLMQKQADQAAMPDMWSTYLRSEDAAATVKAATEHGGQVYMAPMDVPEQGSMAMIADATRRGRRRVAAR